LYAAYFLKKIEFQGNMCSTSPQTKGQQPPKKGIVPRRNSVVDVALLRLLSWPHQQQPKKAHAMMQTPNETNEPEILDKNTSAFCRGLTSKGPALTSPEQRYSEFDPTRSMPGEHARPKIWLEDE
jgi:hypothetical protein